MQAYSHSERCVMVGDGCHAGATSIGAWVSEAVTDGPGWSEQTGGGGAEEERRTGRV
jgi:hypothetical protein